MTAVGGVFLCAAIFHAAALLWPTISEPSPPGRHAVFVVVNAFFALCFATRRPWLVWPFAVLTLQQLWSHGGDVIRSLPRADVQSVVALVGLAAIWVVVIAWKRALRLSPEGER